MSAPERKSTAVRFDPDVYARLQSEADRRDVSVNWLVTRAVERALPGWEAQDLDRLAVTPPA